MKLDAETLKLSSLFSSITRTTVRDCIKNKEEVIFVVNKGSVSKAVGKAGINVKKISAMLKKPVKVIEYREKADEFLTGLLRNENIRVEQEEDVLLVHCKDMKTKGKIYGREKTRLKYLLDMVKRYHPIKEIKVVDR